MSKLVIRKRVSLDFLGEGYSEAYLEFKAMPVPDYDNLAQQIEKATEENKANQTLLDILKKYYIGGKFPNEDGKLEDLDGVEELNSLDGDAILICFSKLTGQDLKAIQSGEIAEGENPLPKKSDTPSNPG